MKIRLVVALVGLALSFALPTFAQQTNTPDPQLREKLVAAIKKHTDALDKNDAAAPGRELHGGRDSSNAGRPDFRPGGHRETLCR